MERPCHSEVIFGSSEGEVCKDGIEWRHMMKGLHNRPLEESRLPTSDNLRVDAEVEKIVQEMITVFGKNVDEYR